MAIAAIFFASIASFLLRLLGVGAIKAWLLGCAVVPIFVLLAEFVLPYSGGGASMWPIALVFGGLCGAAASGVGLLVAVFFVQDKQQTP